MNPTEENHEQEFDLAKQIVAKATGVEPYESDKMEVDARLRDSTTKPHMVSSMREAETMDSASENLTSRSPTFLSGGGGFDYEDYVVAYYLAMMLLQRMPLGAKFGLVERVLWQAEDTGWDFFDDLVLISGTGLQAGISAKTDEHLNTSGFEKGFVSRAWAQFDSTVEREFNEGDLICLAVGLMSNKVKRAWQLLANQFVADLNRQSTRLEPDADGKNPKSSDVQRKIVQSLIDKCDRTTQPTMVEALNLLNNVRVMEFDFLSPPSRDEDAIVQSLQYIVESGERDDAVKLWKELLLICKSNRSGGGDISRNQLVEQSLQCGVRLRSLPNYEVHLKKWELYSATRLRSASWGIQGHTEPLERQNLWEALPEAADVDLPIVLVGASGSGKTSFAREIARREGRICFLLDETVCSAGGILHNGQFTGTSYSICDLLKSETRNWLLLLDSCEKLDDDVLETVLSSVAELNSGDSLNTFKIILTCIPNLSNRIQVALRRHGLTPNTLAVANPRSDQVAHLLSDDTKSFNVANKPQLLDVLTNLKVLELFVRAAELGIVVEETGDMSPSKVFDFLWNDWINRSKRSPERGRLLQRIAFEGSKRLIQTVPIRELGSHETSLLDGLVSDGLVDFDDSVFFTHDFVRDLSRSRTLLDQSVGEIVSCSTDYPWHGAIRLYAQRLAERDFADWFEEFQSVSREVQGWHICHTIFVDGFVQAAEANPQLVSKIWNECGEGDLQMVLRKKFLESVLDAAPLDERWNGHVPQGSISETGTWRKYDSVVIEELFKIADNQLPDEVELRRMLVLICEMTFRRRLSGEKLPSGHIAKVTNVALELADSLISGQQKYRLDENFRTTVYRSLLLSVLVEPARATELILLAAERHPRVVEQLETKTAEPNLKPKGIGVPALMFAESEVGENEAWPNGPLDRVDNDFRKICLESDLLLPLVMIAPEKAKEVLFACTIEPPQSRSRRYRSTDPETGLEDYHTRMDPLYDIGPFLEFFRTRPEHALDYLISITNFAAENWSKSQHRIDLDTRAFDEWGKRLGPFEFEVPSRSATETETCKGNGNIYCWSVGGLPINKTITCAMMAFEFWVYESLDAGKDIDSLLKQAVTESRNAGMAGCLIDIGKKHPKLFTGPLRNLLGCWAFYAWDAAKVLQNSSMPPLMIGRGMTSSPRRVKLASDWLRQPHRETDLIRLAAMLLVRNVPFREFIDECRQRWTSEEFERFSVHQIKYLQSVFDWNNYRIESREDGTELVSYHPPAEIVQDAIAVNDELENKQLLLMFPFQCRQLIKKGEALDAEQFNRVWNSIQKIHDLPITEKESADQLDDPVNRRVNCVSAGVAAILSLGKAHLTKEVTQFCRKQFEALITEPPRIRRFNMPESPAEYSWDYSLADMTIAYLVDDANDEAARWGVTRCITAFHYQSLEHFMNLARDSREKFPKLFSLLPRYARIFAALREQISRVGKELGHAESCFQRWQEQGGTGDYEIMNGLKSLREEYESLMKSFDGFDFAVANWEEVDVNWREIVEQSVGELKEISKRLDALLFFPNRDDDERSLGHLDIGIDLDLVHYGFNWIDLSLASDDAEYQSWVAEIEGLIELRRMLVPELTDIQKFRNWDYGHKFDTFVMSLACRNIVGSLDNDTSEVWKKMLDDISVEPKFVDDFLSHLNAMVYDAKSRPEQFTSLWSAMIEHALGSKDWSGNDIPVEQWKSLLGMSFSAQLQFPEIDPVWSNSVSVEISKRRSVFAEAIDRAIQSPSVCAGLIEHFRQPLWRSLRLDILEKLAASPLANRDEIFFPAEEVASFLTVCWSDHARQIIKQSEIENAFQSLLSKSIRAGSAGAKELGQVVGLVERT